MLRLKGDAEAGFFGLIRGAIAVGERFPHLRRMADALYDLVRPAAADEGEPVASPPPQLALWVVDSDGLPPRPWRLYRDSIVDCTTLGCPVPAHICVARQIAAGLQRTHDTHRGQASEYVTCVTERCAQGRGVRAALDPQDAVVWKGEGAGKRASPTRRRREKAKQNAARSRMESVGLLDEVRTLDIHPDPVVEEDEHDQEGA
jgi:hypothetical protein